MFRTLVARRVFVSWSLGALVAAPLRVLADSSQDTGAAAPLTDLVRHPLLARSLTPRGRMPRAWMVWLAARIG